MQLNLNKINSWEDEKCHSLFRTMGDIQRQVDIECLLQKQSNGLPPNQIGTIVPNEVTHSFPINNQLEQSAGLKPRRLLNITSLPTCSSRQEKSDFFRFNSISVSQLGEKLTRMSN